MEHNPDIVLDTILTGKRPLTLAQIALLEKAKSPVLDLQIDSLNEDIKAVYLLSLPIREAAAKLQTADIDCLEWVEKVGDDEYKRLLDELVCGLIAFYEMLPKAEKKTNAINTSATGGLPN